MPSKQLLSNVLKKELYLYHLCDIQDNQLLYYTEENGGGEYINIYELADRCIEQSEKLGYSIIAISDFDLRHCVIEEYKNYWFTAYVNMNLFPDLNEKETHLYDVSEETRPKAIISAFEWILENKDKK